MAGRAEGAMAPQFFRNRWIFGNFTALLENFQTFAVGKDKRFKFYRKIFELGPPYSTCVTTLPGSHKLLALLSRVYFMIFVTDCALK